MYNAMAWRCSSGQGKPRHPALKELTGSSPDLLAHVLCVWNDHSPPPSPTCCMFKPPHSLGSVLYVFSVLKLVLRTSGQKSSLLMLTSPLLCFFFFFFFSCIIDIWGLSSLFLSIDSRKSGVVTYIKRFASCTASLIMTWTHLSMQ